MASNDGQVHDVRSGTKWSGACPGAPKARRASAARRPLRYDDRLAARSVNRQLGGVTTPGAPIASRRDPLDTREVPPSCGSPVSQHNRER